MITLVLVRFQEAWLSYRPPETAAFSQAVADHLVSRGICEAIGSLQVAELPRESFLEASDVKLARAMMRLRGETILE